VETAVIDRGILTNRLLEGVTIVLSILSAFALQSWWDNHLAARALDEGVRSVAEELARAQQHLEGRIGVYDVVEEYLMAVLELLAEGDGSVIEVPDTLMAAVLYTPTIDPPTGALAAFLESGLLPSVADAELRQRLGGLPSAYEDGADDERDALDYALTSVRPMLERSLSAQDFAAVLGQTQRIWSMYKRPWNTPFSAVRVRATAELHNAIASRLQMLRLSRGEVADLRGVTTRTLAVLEQTGT
jgi:hypothetical protein